MRIKKKSKSTRIREALIKDSINYIVGFSKIPVPLETIKEFISIIKKEKNPLYFVDWKLEDWPKMYHKELGKCVKLPYRGEEYFLPQVLIFDNTERKLNLSNIYFHLKESPFDLPSEIRALTEEPFEKLLDYLKKKKRYSNEQNLRLVNIIEKREKIILEVQEVEYKYYVHTNLVLDYKSDKKGESLRERLHSQGSLEDLKESPLANNLGVNILLFTADGSLIIQKRSKKVAFRNDELSPSASGTFSIIDVPVVDIKLKDVPKLREAFEELGIFREDIPPDQIFFLGITRELIRGGEPEMFFFAKTNLSEKQVKDRWEDARDKWETEKLIFFHFGQIVDKKLYNKMEIHRFLSKVDEFIDTHIDQSSITLLTSLALWVKYRIT